LTAETSIPPSDQYRTAVTEAGSIRVRHSAGGPASSASCTQARTGTPCVATTTTWCSNAATVAARTARTRDTS